jgi:transposase
MPRRQTASSPPDPATAAFLQTLHPHAAGIDVGATAVGVCVPPSAVASPLLGVPRGPTGLPPQVRRFGAFTAALHAIAAWLRQCQVTPVARASTGVSWSPLSALLEAERCEVLLVDPRQGQRAPNRPQTDVHDCQGSQRRHSRGLRTAACRPAEPLRVWRSAQRHRARLIEEARRPLQRREKALEQRNGKLPAVGSASTGVTGMGSSRAIVQGERDPQA